jgi:hypothetical protein
MSANSFELIRGGNRSKSRLVLTVRLCQEKLEFYQAWMRGEYKSVTAAAIAAGLLKDDVNLRRAKSACRKMSRKEWREFVKWMRAEFPEYLEAPKRRKK